MEEHINLRIFVSIFLLLVELSLSEKLRTASGQNIDLPYTYQRLSPSPPQMRQATNHTAKFLFFNSPFNSHILNTCHHLAN